MRSLSPTKPRSPRRSSGFTLIEMLIIAPLVVILIGTFVGIMMNMVSDALVTRDQNLMAYDTQTALNNIEQDAFLSTQFYATSGALPNFQGSDNDFSGTAAFGSSNSLVMSTFTTTKNPSDTSRQLVYYANQPNACGSLENANKILTSKVIYFVRNGSLWRRVIVPTWDQNATVDANTVCDPPWQRGSCTPESTTANSSNPTSVCQSSDTELVKNVQSFNVDYYTSPGSTTILSKSAADTATTINVTITTDNNTVGRDISYNASMRATKFNSSTTP